MAKDNVGDKDCANTNVINDKGYLEPVDTCHGSLLGSVREKVDDKSVKVIVKRDSGNGSGSGFFIEDGTQVQTDAHVVNGSKHIEIMTPDGQKRQAHIVALDDVHDLATLQVEGIKTDKARAVDINESSTLSRDSWVFGLGVPDLTNTKHFLAPGRAQAMTTVREIMARTGAFDQRSKAGEPPTLAELLSASARSSNPAERKDAEDYLNASRVDMIMGGKPGMSGGVNVGEDLLFAGVSNASYRRGDGTIGTTMVPDDVVRESHASPSKFDFNYERKSVAQLNPMITYSKELLDAAVPAGATAARSLAAEAAMSRVARFVPGAYGIYKGSSILDDYRSYSDVNNDAERRAQYGQKVAEDGGYGVGGVLMTVGMVASSRVRPVMLGLGALAYAGSYISSVMRDHAPTYNELKSVQRKDGDPRPPLLWDLGR